MNFFSQRLLRRLLVCLAGLFLTAALLFFTLPLPGQIPVLMYHFIGSRQDAQASGNFVSLETFEKQMLFLKRFGYRVISLEQFDEIRAGKRKPQGREIVLTFDDGNPSVFKLAWPIMKNYGFPSTQFMISEGLKNGTRGSVALNDIRDIRTEPLLTWGAHSRTHPFLSQVPDSDLESEIAGAKFDLEEQLGFPVHYFAYPFGDFDRRAVRAAEKAGYRLAFTTSPKKLNSIGRRNYSLTRIKISENSKNLFIFWFKLTGFYESYKLWRERRLRPSGD